VALEPWWEVWEGLVACIDWSMLVFAGWVVRGVKRAFGGLIRLGLRLLHWIVARIRSSVSESLTHNTLRVGTTFICN